jgi:sugar/nucleoside kinase (ribokinase family)
MTTDRLPNNQEDREVYLREHNAANFIEAIVNARRDSLDTVIMTVKAFAGEPDVLYVALDYAHHSGVTVTMAPDPGQDEPSS